MCTLQTIPLTSSHAKYNNQTNNGNNRALFEQCFGIHPIECRRAGKTASNSNYKRWCE